MEFSITNCRSLLKLMSIELVMSSNHRILCCPLLLLPSIFPSIRVFSSDSVLPIRWPKNWMPGFPLHHQLPKLAQAHVHRVGDATQPSDPLLFPSLPAFNLPQHQGLSQESVLHSIPALGRSPGEGNGNPLQYYYLENPMVGYSPWGCKELDMTEQLHFHFHMYIQW